MIWTRLMVVAAVLGLPVVGQVTAERLGAMRSDLLGQVEGM